MTNTLSSVGRSLPVRAPRTDEDRRRLICQLILLFFLGLLAEGILRKWLFNGIEQVFLFIRDPTLLVIYLIYAQHKQLWRTNWFLWWFASLLMTLVLIILQLDSTDLPWLVYMLGVRSYLAYIPLMFIMMDVMRREDIYRYIKLTLWLSIPIMLLVTLQFFSPVASNINRGLSDDVNGRFLVIAGIVRPYGPFTFTQAQATYSVLSLCSLLIGLEWRRELQLSWLALGVFAFACFAMGALSGARTYFIGAGIVIGSYLLASFTAPGVKQGGARLLSVAAVVLGFLVVFVFVFPTSFDAMLQRQESTMHGGEDLTRRSLSSFTEVGVAFSDAPPVGLGLGAGSNAGAAARGETADWSLGENDWPRIVMETGPFAGALYISFRIAAFFWLLYESIAANRRTGDVSALVMFGIAGPTLLVQQITAQNQMLSFCWFTCGMTLALARTSERPAA